MIAMLAHTSAAEHVGIAVIAVAAVAIYGAAWWRLPSPRRSTWRLWSWTIGVTALAVSTSPPLERLATESFTGHMVQHLLMLLVAAPLLVLARPVRTIRPSLVASGPTRRERRIATWWHRTGVVLAPAMFVVVLFVTHLTAIYDEALSSRVVHDLEHVAYLGVAVGLWAVVQAPGRAGAVGRVGMAFAVIAGSAFLGVILLTASSPLVPTYADTLGVESALDDQRRAASLMWVSGMALTLPLLLTAVWRWAASEQRAAERAESLPRSNGVTGVTH